VNLDDLPQLGIRTDDGIWIGNRTSPSGADHQTMLADRVPYSRRVLVAAINVRFCFAGAGHDQLTALEVSRRGQSRRGQGGTSRAERSSQKPLFNQLPPSASHAPPGRQDLTDTQEAQSILPCLYAPCICSHCIGGVPSLYPLIPVRTMPWMKCRWATKKTAIIGMTDTTVMAIVHSKWPSSRVWNMRSPMERVITSGRLR
jgi:hypothetical protein